MKLKLLLLPIFLVSFAFTASAAHDFVLDLEESGAQYAFINSDLGRSAASARTYNGWFKLESNPTTIKRVFFDHTEDTDNVSYLLDYLSNSGDGANTRLRFTRDRDGIAATTIYYEVNLNDSAWHFFTATYDGTNLELFLDGTSVAGPTADTGNGTGATYGDLFQIGKLSYAGQYYDGLIDDVSVYSVELNGGQITALFNDGCTVSTSNLIALWEFENDYLDLQASYDLTSGGSPTFVSETEHGCAPPEEPVATTTLATSTPLTIYDKTFLTMIAVFAATLLVLFTISPLR